MKYYVYKIICVEGYKIKSVQLFLEINRKVQTILFNKQMV